jgi:hypothetical protein
MAVIAKLVNNKALEKAAENHVIVMWQNLKIA